ncbi:MAG: FHA domain-containing protein [Eubacteriales bacterium]
MKPESHFLLIDKGTPHRKGDRLQLDAGDILLGRFSKTDKPDIAFDSLYVSRKHALLTWCGEGFFIIDLESKHGTQINGAELEPNRPIKIKHGDQISLSHDMALMTYAVSSDFDDRTITLANVFAKNHEAISIDLDRMEVRLEGALLNFSGKERDLLLMLYRNRNKAISYDEIKIELWPERRLDNNATPDVGNDEILALVYRLRKRLGKHGQKIVTVARYGVILEP